MTQLIACCLSTRTKVKIPSTHLKIEVQCCLPTILLPERLRQQDPDQFTYICELQDNERFSLKQGWWRPAIEEEKLSCLFLASIRTWAYMCKQWNLPSHKYTFSQCKRRCMYVCMYVTPKCWNQCCISLCFIHEILKT